MQSLKIWRHIMKQLIFGLLAITLLFSACDQVNAPMPDENQINKKYVASQDNNFESLKLAIIPLPEKSPLYLDSVFTVTKIINGLLGGTITLDKSYISKEGKLVTVLVNMVIPPLAFFGQRTITCTIEDSLAIMDCGPDMTFGRSLTLVQTFTGLDLMSYDVRDIDFGYINEDGHYYPIQRSSLIVNKQLGLVSIVNGKIGHFSKYGWVRKSGNSD